MSVESLLELSPPLLLLAALNVLGYAVKKSPIPNWLAPWILLGTGALVYPLIAEIGKVSFNVANPMAFNIVVGFCIGGAAVGVHQCFRVTKDRHEEGPAAPKQ